MWGKILTFLVSDAGQLLVTSAVGTVAGWLGLKKVKSSRWAWLLRAAWDAFRTVKIKGDREKWDNNRRWDEWQKLMIDAARADGKKPPAGDELGKLGQLVYLWYHLVKDVPAEKLATMSEPPTSSTKR